MEKYLAAKGAPLENKELGAFSPYLKKDNDVDSLPSSETEPVDKQEIQTIYDEKDCPKVEVVSIDGLPNKLLIHLQDGKLLEINCLY